MAAGTTHTGLDQVVDILSNDTGLNANIGMRLKAVEPHLAGEEYFLANYSDGLTDLSLAEQMTHFLAHDKIASFMSVKPNLSFHLVNADERGWVNLDTAQTCFDTAIFADHHAGDIDFVGTERTLKSRNSGAIHSDVHAEINRISGWAGVERLVIHQDFIAAGGDDTRRPGRLLVGRIV